MQKNLVNFEEAHSINQANAAMMSRPEQIKYFELYGIRYLIDKDIIEAEVALTLEGANAEIQKVVVHTSIELTDCESPEQVHSLLYMKAAQLFRKAQVGFSFDAWETRLAS